VRIKLDESLPARPPLLRHALLTMAVFASVVETPLLVRDFGLSGAAEATFQGPPQGRPRPPLPERIRASQPADVERAALLDALSDDPLMPGHWTILLTAARPNPNRSYFELLSLQACEKRSCRDRNG
jgi:hypothetical protein